MIVNQDDIEIILNTVLDIAQGDEKHELFLLRTALNNLMMDEPLQDVIESIASAEQAYWEWYRPEIILKLQGDLWMKGMSNKYCEEVDSAKKKALKNQEIIKSRTKANVVDNKSVLKEEKQSIESLFKKIRPPDNSPY